MADILRHAPDGAKDYRMSTHDDPLIPALCALTATITLALVAGTLPRPETNPTHGYERRVTLRAGVTHILPVIRYDMGTDCYTNFPVVETVKPDGTIDVRIAQALCPIENETDVKVRDAIGMPTEGDDITDLHATTLRRPNILERTPPTT